MTKTKKLLLFLVTFVLTVVTLTTSTAAWITLPARNRVDNIQFSVIKDSRLQISFDGINYYDEINEEIVRMYLPSIGAPDLTTMDGKTFTSIYENSLAPEFSFELYFRAERSAANCIYLVDNVSNNYSYDEIGSSIINGTYAISQGVRWTPGADFDNGYGDVVKKNETRIYYGDDAIRISFIEQNASNQYLQIVDNRTEYSSFIWDPSEDETRGFGMPFGAYDYVKKLRRPDLELPSEVPNTIYHLSLFDKESKKVNNANSLVATMQQGLENNFPYKYAKVRVNIWFEGWDPDCIDGVTRDIVKLQFKFICADPA